MFYVQNINIYEFRGVRGMYIVHGPPGLHHTFFVYYSKKKKVQEHDLYLNQILHFSLNFFFLGWIIKNLWKGPKGALLLFLYEVRIVVLNWFHSNTPNSRHFFITNCKYKYVCNTFFRKNIKMHFPKIWVLKFWKWLQTFIIHWNEVK